MANHERAWRSLVRAAIVLLVVAAIVWGARVWMRPKPIEVVVRSVERGWVEDTVSNTRAGTVMACHRSKLAPQTGGQVERLPVRKGDRVKKDAVLLEIWNEDLRSQLELSEREAKAASARAEQACLSADLAARESDRMARLFQSKIVDEQTRDRAESEARSTRSACEAGRATADESRSRIAVARAALEKTILRAPFDGVVGEVSAEVGEMVIPSPPGIPTPPAIDLIEEGCLYVVAPIDEVDARRARPGLPARITLDAYPGQTIQGSVRRVAPFVLDTEKQARTRDVEVDIKDPASFPGLVPGYSADVEVILERREDVLRVPAEAISGEGRVMVLRGDGILEARKITPGISNWQYVEVASGLSEGERVVVSLDRAGVESGAAAVAESEGGG